MAPPATVFSGRLYRFQGRNQALLPPEHRARSVSPQPDARAASAPTTPGAGIGPFRQLRARLPAGPSTPGAAYDDVASSPWRALQCYLLDNGDFVQSERSDDGVELELERHSLTPLFRSSVRLVDESLLAKRHCFSTCDTDGRLAYFAAPSRHERLLWVSLLKQATTRIDSRGSRYRVDREVRLRIMEARGLAIPAGMAMAHTLVDAKKDKQGWLATIEVGGERAARTVVVPGSVSNARSASPSPVTAEVFWMEDFAIGDMGSTGGELTVTVWSRVVSSSGRRKEARVGTATVSLVAIKPGEIVEEWFAIMGPQDAREARAGAGLARRPSTSGRASQSDDKDSVVGELRLRIRYDRLSVLPTATYAPLLRELEDVSGGLVYDLLLSVDAPERLIENIVRIYTAKGLVQDWLKDLIEREVRSANDTQTLFRGNTVVTKAVDAYMRLVGWQYLDDTVGGVVRWICDSRVQCELDPSRLDATADITHQTEELAAYATILWKKVESTIPTFPEELRKFFAHVQYAVVSRFDPATHPHARYTSVSGFLFLRLFCPAILSPRQFELVREHPPQKTLRTLTLLAKLIQSLGNLTEFGAKEPYMKPMNPFIRDHSRGLMEFIDQVVEERRGAGALMSPIPAPATLDGGPVLEPRRSEDVRVEAREGGGTFAPPCAPYLIDTDRELAQLAISVSGQRERVVSGGAGKRPNGTTRVSSGCALEQLVEECERLQTVVTRLRKEGKDATRRGGR